MQNLKPNRITRYLDPEPGDCHLRPMLFNDDDCTALTGRDCLRAMWWLVKAIVISAALLWGMWWGILEVTR